MKSAATRPAERVAVQAVATATPGRLAAAPGTSRTKAAYARKREKPPASWTTVRSINSVALFGFVWWWCRYLSDS